MKKKGTVEIVFVVISFIIVAGSLIAGSYLLTSSDTSISEYKFIGELSSKKFYNAHCVPQIKERDRVVFKSFSDAENFGYTFSAECPRWVN